MTAELNVRRAYRHGRTMDAVALIAHQPVSAIDLADHLAVNIRTARSILRRLEQDRWLRRVGSHPARYHPNDRLRELGARLALSRH